MIRPHCRASARRLPRGWAKGPHLPTYASTCLILPALRRPLFLHHHCSSTLPTSVAVLRLPNVALSLPAVGPSGPLPLLGPRHPAIWLAHRRWANRACRQSRSTLAFGRHYIFLWKDPSFALSILFMAGEAPHLFAQQVGPCPGSLLLCVIAVLRCAAVPLAMSTTSVSGAHLSTSINSSSYPPHMKTKEALTEEAARVRAKYCWFNYHLSLVKAILFCTVFKRKIK